MTNMFSGNREKEIPQTFKDCYKSDNVSNSLWLWCERIEKIGLVLFVITIIAGLYFSISSSIIEKNVVVKEATYWSDARTEIRTVFEFENFLISLFYTALSALLEYFIYHIIALFIGALATIVQSTRITANVALYKFATENNISTNNISLSVDYSNDKLTKILTGNNSNNTVKKLCPHCGNSIKSNICDMCGKENNLF